MPDTPDESMEERLYPGFKKTQQDDVVLRKGHIPQLALRWLRWLTAMRLHATLRDDDMHLLRLGKGQTFWLSFKGRYTRDHYRLPHPSVRGVSDERDVAILAALTNSVAIPTDMEHLRSEVLPHVRTLLESGECETLEAALEELGRPKHSYELELLKYFRVDLDTYALEDQIALFEETCRRINEFLEASWRFVNFLEFGMPGRDLRPEVEKANIERDVRSAVLRDVGDLTYRQIGEVLEVPPPPDFKVKGDYPAIRQMVRRGRRILAQALGEEGWQVKAKNMKAEAQRQRDESLGLRAYMVARGVDMSEEEVRSKIGYDPVHGEIFLDQELEAEWLENLRVERLKSERLARKRVAEAHIRWKADTQGQDT